MDVIVVQAALALIFDRQVARNAVISQHRLFANWKVKKKE
jgi:hypothetical protein